VPDRILRAMHAPTIDHRSPDFAELAFFCLAGMKDLFQTKSPVVIYPASGTGAWEAALVNTLRPGDLVLTVETGQFGRLWANVARNLGLRVEVIPTDWRHGVDAGEIEARLAGDGAAEIAAVMIVHNETSTGVKSDVAAVRRALDAAKHSALLMVDTISSLASIEYRHDEWGVDIAVGGSQKGLMLPPGLSFNALSARALEAGKRATLPNSFWRWDAMLEFNAKGFFPFTPATNLLFGLREALHMLAEEGLENVFRRHRDLAEATRRAAGAWGLEIVARDARQYSATVTGVMMPDGHDEAALRRLILEKFNMSLGAGLGKFAGRVFRIGHIGDLNALTLAGTLCGVEMGLELAGVPHRKGGVDAALACLAEQARQR
jgi:alanine-glyoxylate transaminase/serine-glyoxylate transaminase/serine-pyruvate transaminase